MVAVYFAENGVGSKSINILRSEDKTLKMFKYLIMLLVKSIFRKISDSNCVDTYTGLKSEWILPTTFILCIVIVLGYLKIQLSTMYV